MSILRVLVHALMDLRQMSLKEWNTKRGFSIRLEVNAIYMTETHWNKYSIAEMIYSSRQHNHVIILKLGSNKNAFLLSCQLDQPVFV